MRRIQHILFSWLIHLIIADLASTKYQRIDTQVQRRTVLTGVCFESIYDETKITWSLRSVLIQTNGSVKKRNRAQRYDAIRQGSQCYLRRQQIRIQQGTTGLVLDTDIAQYDTVKKTYLHLPDTYLGMKFLRQTFFHNTSQPFLDRISINQSHQQEIASQQEDRYKTYYVPKFLYGSTLYNNVNILCLFSEKHKMSLTQ